MTKMYPSSPASRLYICSNNYNNYISPLVNRRWKGYRHVVNKLRRFTGNPKRFDQQRKMLSKDEFCLTLMKLRLGSLYGDLASGFCLATSLTSQVFRSWLTAMAKVLGHLIWCVPMNHLNGSKPKAFQLLINRFISVSGLCLQNNMQFGFNRFPIGLFAANQLDKKVSLLF